MKIDEINSKIDELEREKRFILDQEKLKYAQDLQWIKKCSISLNPVTQFGDGPKYKFGIYGEYPILNDSIQLYQDIYYGPDRSFIAYNNFGTSTSRNMVITGYYLKTMLEFLEKFEFKSISYNEETLQLLLLAEKLNKERAT